MITIDEIEYDTNLYWHQKLSYKLQGAFEIK